MHDIHTFIIAVMAIPTGIFLLGKFLGYVDNKQKISDLTEIARYKYTDTQGD